MPDDPQYDASRVMFNGAAIALVTSLVNGMEKRLGDEMRLTEERLTGKLLAVSLDVDAIEAWQDEVERQKQRRLGQWSVFTNALAFAEKHQRALWAVIAALLLVLSRLLGIEVTIAS